jgi:uncharacterized protein YcnI/copper(I)-binding protein
MAKFPLMAAAGCTLLLSATAAFAHATFEPQAIEPGKTYKHVLRVPHGCDGQATNLVRIQIPQGVHSVKPMPKPGWTLNTVRGAYAQPVMAGEKALTEGVTEIIWSGGNLPDAHYDEFAFRAVIAPAAAGEGQVFFPTVQECASAKAAWIEIPAKGQDPHALKMPAPGVKVTLAQHAQGQHGQSHQGHGQPAQATAPATIKAGDLAITAPWTRATPGGAKVAGGYMRITNTGKEADRLIGGSLPQAGRFEVHEMATVNNTMVMRQLEKGLEIKPGETVELKPGGYHVMFMDLKEPLKQGAPLKGTLVFQRAGTVNVEYVVAPIGATSPDGKAGAGGGHTHH